MSTNRALTGHRWVAGWVEMRQTRVQVGIRGSWTWLMMLACAGLGVLGRADDRGASVVVVYNSAMPDSLAVARHYAERRGVPTNQLVGLMLPETEVISRGDYESRLQNPLVTELSARGLWRLRDEIRPATEDRPGQVVQRVAESRIRNLVVCYGVPLRIAEDATRRDAGALSLPDGLRRNEAAVDADLTVLPLLLAGGTLMGPVLNPFFMTTNAAALQPLAGLLVVGRLDGPSAAQSAALVDRAIEAEQNGLLGRAYFDLRSITDPSFLAGDRWISNAWSAARSYGFDTVADLKAATIPAGFPMSHVALYAGWYGANVSGPMAEPQVEFVPGAIAYHLHSFSAATLKSTNSGWVGPFIARGVTATMGTVSEPYLDGTPDIGAAFVRLMYFGFTWGEAAIASQRLLSWQLTVVGDPLYRPFSRNALDRMKDLAQRRDGRVDWAMVMLYNRRHEIGGKLDAIIADLESETRLKFSPILQEKLADFHRDAGHHDRAAEGYRKASRLNPSPHQRRRLAWNAGEESELAGHPREAYEAYKALAEDPQAWDDPGLLFARLCALGEKLHERSDLRRWTIEMERLKITAPK